MSSQLYRCDSIVDCNDQSDESARYCSNSTHCDPDTYHQCDNGDCIFLSWRCDSYPDCADGSDERDCNCMYAKVFSVQEGMPHVKIRCLLILNSVGFERMTTMASGIMVISFGDT